MRHSASSRSCSKLWETPETRSRSCHSRAKSVTHSCPSGRSRSAAMRRRVLLVGAEDGDGTLVSCRSAAPSIARCTPLTPLTAAEPRAEADDLLQLPQLRQRHHLPVQLLHECPAYLFRRSAQKRRRSSPGRTVCTHTHRFPYSPGDVAKRTSPPAVYYAGGEKQMNRMIQLLRRRRLYLSVEAVLRFGHAAVR